MAATSSASSASLSVRWLSWSPYLLSLLRIVAAFLFIQFGSAKLLALPAAVMPGGGTAPLMSLPGIAGALEMVGGALLLLGLLTRPVAFILSGEMAVAYFMGHAPQGFWPVLNQGSPAILFCFIWLYLSSAGPGPWSLDAILRRGSADSRFDASRAR
jgi:putative oxidoreductase